MTKEQMGRATVAKEHGHCDRTCGQGTRCWLAALLPCLSPSVSFGLDRRSLGECLDKTSPCDLSPERAPNCSAMDAMANTTERWGYLEDMADWSGPVLMTPRGFFLEPLGYVSHGLFHYVATWVSARRGIRVIKKSFPRTKVSRTPLGPRK